MYLRELITEEPLRIGINEGVPAWLIAMIRIDTSSSQWRKTKRGSIQTKELRCVQLALTELGYDVGKADGWFGRKTARGVMAFQRDNDLTVDGDPGRNTIGKMIELGKEKFSAAKTLTKDNVDVRFPPEIYPLDDCAEIIVPEPEEDDDGQETGEPAYKVVRGSGQMRRYTVYDAQGNEIRNGRGPGPSNIPTQDEYNRTPGREDLPVGSLPAAPFDPAQAVQGKSAAEVEQLIANLIRQRKFKDALALADFDMRVNISDESYRQLKQLAANSESLEEKQVWAKSGQKVVRKHRCTAGSRKGRVVKEPAQCFRAPDVKRRIQLKKTKARMGARMARKAKRTKRVNPTSRRVAALNRMASR